MKYKELEAHLEKAAVCADGGPEPLYIVCGGDSYLKRRAVKQFCGLVAPEYSEFNLSIVPSARGMAAAVDALSTYPMFGGIKVVLVPDVADRLNDTERALLEGYLSSPNPSSVLVLVCDGEAGKDYVGKPGKGIVDCSRPDDNDIRAMIAEMLAEPPAASMEGAAAGELISRTLGDMSRIACEVLKLKAYAQGRPITRKDVAEMTTPELEFQIYELSDAVSSKDGGRSLRVLDAFIKQGIKPNTVIGLLYNHYRKMLHVELHKTDSDAELAKLLGVKPGALFHTRRISKNYSQVRLKKSVDYLHGLQCAVIGGKRSEATALHDAVLTLLYI